jgi:inhibitor of KinA
MDEGLNDLAIAMADHLRIAAINGILDVVVAYCSVSVFYDPCRIRQKDLLVKLRDICQKVLANQLITRQQPNSVIRVPVCYDEEFAPDLPALAHAKGIGTQELAKMHYNRVYKVYMIGFLPGFPYMGMVDPVLATPRKRFPVPVKAGAVGIAGNQTGIYPVDSPGGWQIIGRTPITLFDRNAADPVRLKAGDKIQFFPVDAAEFNTLSSVPVSGSFKTISDQD